MDKGLRIFCLRLCAAFFCLLGSAAYAAEDGQSPWYVAGHVAAAFTQDSDFRSGIDLPSPPVRAEMLFTLPFKTGWGVGAAVGREFGDSWRLEGEIFRRQAKPGQLSVESAIVGGRDFTDAFKTVLETGGEGGGPAFVVGGRLKFTSVMINGFYDIPTPWAWRPYIGAGAGVVKRTMNKHVEIHLPSSFGATADAIEDSHESHWDFIYQLQAGVGVPLTDALELELGYRYKALPGAALHFFEDGEGGAIAPVRVEMNASHSVDIGLLWRF